MHKELVAGKAKLEYSVHVKTHSLLIDLTKCLPARKVMFCYSLNKGAFVIVIDSEYLNCQVYPMRLKGDWQNMLEQVT